MSELTTTIGFVPYEPSLEQCLKCPNSLICSTVAVTSSTVSGHMVVRRCSECSTVWSYRAVTVSTRMRYIVSPGCGTDATLNAFTACLLTADNALAQHSNNTSNIRNISNISIRTPWGSRLLAPNRAYNPCEICSKRRGAP